MVQRPGHYDGMNKNDWKCVFEMWIWRMERVQWTDTKIAAVLERMGGGRIMLELIKKRKINWLRHC